MPRPNRGYQLKFYKPRGYRDRQWTVFWYERGTRREHATGIKDSRALKDAEDAKADFVAARERPAGPVTPDRLLISQALEIYAREHGPTTVDPARIGYAVDALLPFWGHLTASAITIETSRRYAVWRGKAANTVRRELGTLNAATEYCRAAGRLTSAPTATLPERGASRDRWLTRIEAAALLRSARKQRKARLYLPTFILLGLYTGHRAEAIQSLQWQPNTEGGWIDLEKGRIDFNPIGRRQTNKRRSHIPIPGALMVHLRQVRKRTRQYVVECEGEQVASCRRSFTTACRGAVVLVDGEKKKGLTGVVRHTLSHTACTWFMHRRVDVELAAAWVGKTPETFRRVYMHHHPDYMGEALDSFKKSPSLSPSLRGKPNAIDREQKTGNIGNGTRK